MPNQPTHGVRHLDFSSDKERLCGVCKKEITLRQHATGRMYCANPTCGSFFWDKIWPVSVTHMSKPKFLPNGQLELDKRGRVVHHKVRVETNVHDSFIARLLYDETPDGAALPPLSKEEKVKGWASFHTLYEKLTPVSWAASEESSVESKQQRDANMLSNWAEMHAPTLGRCRKPGTRKGEMVLKPGQGVKPGSAREFREEAAPRKVRLKKDGTPAQAPRGPQPYACRISDRALLYPPQDMPEAVKSYIHGGDTRNRDYDKSEREVVNKIVIACAEEGMSMRSRGGIKP